MSLSFTQSTTQTFNVTHARHLASKVATDLKRIQRFYGSPTDTYIAKYEAELIELLKAGYLYELTYGFKRGDNWIEPTLKYTAKELANTLGSDDDPGRVRPGADVSGASFTSYLAHNSAYTNLTTEQLKEFEATLPFNRVYGVQPGISGYLTSDKTYSSGGRSLDRSYVKSA